MVESHQFDPTVQQFQVGVLVQGTVVQQGNEAELRAGSLGQHLPGHQIAVVLQRADHQGVPRLEEGAEAVGHQVDAFGGATRPEDFVGVGRIEVHAELLARGFKGVRGALAQGVHAAVYVGVVRSVVVVYGVQNAYGLLHRGRVVQVHQGASVNRLLQDGKFIQ